jgi:hypothetical protein
VDRVIIGNVIRHWCNIPNLARPVPHLNSLQLIVEERRRFIESVLVIPSEKLPDLDGEHFGSDRICEIDRSRAMALPRELMNYAMPQLDDLACEHLMRGHAVEI